MRICDSKALPSGPFTAVYLFRHFQHVQHVTRGRPALSTASKISTLFNSCTAKKASTMGNSKSSEGKDGTKVFAGLTPPALNRNSSKGRMPRTKTFIKRTKTELEDRLAEAIKVRQRPLAHPICERTRTDLECPLPLFLHRPKPSRGTSRRSA
jgi:hypothetical protein